MPGLYLTIQQEIIDIWTAAWTHNDVSVYWRFNDADPLPDPSTATHFMRNEIDFGRELLMAFGSGRFSNERSQFGSVILRVFTSRAQRSEDVALELMADAVGIFRSQRVGNLSFIGEGSGFIESPSEDGNWFVRGCVVVWEYRFQG